MAFVEPSGSGFVVKQGNTGEVLSRFSSRKAASDEVAKLHRKNNPASANRGASAKANQGKTAQRAKATGKKKPTPRATPRKKSAAATSRRSVTRMKRGSRRR